MASTLPIKTTNTYDIGSSTLGLRALYFGANSQTVNIKGSSSMSATWTFTLPVTAGTDGYSLVTNGSGVSSWTQVVPPGVVMPYGAATAPTGWLLCDGSAVSRTTYAALFAIVSTTFGVGNGSTTFNVPDLRGIFIRGAGSNGTLTNANGSAFSGTLGTYQNDKMQGHYHGPSTLLRDSTARYPTDGGGSYALGTGAGNTTGPITDGTNGTSRTGTETNPANLSLAHIIKT